MKQVISSEKIPIKLWLDDIEGGTLNQAKNLANLPFAFGHIAIMPDAHLGYGMPIGGVLATRDVIIPNAVGVDIGCGICAVATDLTEDEVDSNSLKKIMGKIRKAVPVGFKHHKQKQHEKWMPERRTNVLPVVNIEYKNALTQVGTLGGGNHFIEIQKGSDGVIWLMIHSGSRNIGLKVARHYNNLALKMNKKLPSGIPKSWQLAFLPLDSKSGRNYQAEMNFCVEFAFANRGLMMARVKDVMTDVLKNIHFADMINIAHNYAAMEDHFCKNLMVHRKGATRARKGETGIIPGSQGTNSYIVRGLGNPESFESCSHGAGRKMGRKHAQRSLNFATEKKLLDDLGVVHGMRTAKDLDEAAGAYKDICLVMENQKDLVDIVAELRPLAVIKG